MQTFLVLVGNLSELSGFDGVFQFINLFDFSDFFADMAKYEAIKLVTGADMPLFGLGTWLVSFLFFIQIVSNVYKILFYG